jgi:hypothetical protein
MISNTVKEQGVNLVRDGNNLVYVELRAEDLEGFTFKYFNACIIKKGKLILEADDDAFLCDSVEDLDDWLGRIFDTALSWEALEKLKNLLKEHLGYESKYDNWR